MKFEKRDGFVDKKYSESLGEVGDFETEDGNQYSKLIHAKIEELERLSDGGEFGKINTARVEMEDGAIDIFATKVGKTPEFDAIETIKKYRLLKQIGVKTFDKMFIGKGGKVIFTTLLNKDGVVALSSNNELPSPSSCKNNINYEKVFNKNLRIKNLEKILNNLIEQAVLSSKVGVKLAHECLFFLIPENHDNKGVDIDFVVGDFDLLKIDDYKKDNLADDSLFAIYTNLLEFIDNYADDGLEFKPKYLKMIHNKLNPILKDNQIFTKNGIKSIDEYDSEDGEILKMNQYNLDENTSWEEIDSLSNIPSIQKDLTHIKTNLKEKIGHWKGSLAESSLTFDYATLQTIGGELEILGSMDFATEALQAIGGILRAQHVNTFSANNLTRVSEILLTKSEFAQYWQTGVFDWDDAYADGALVLKEELRDKVHWV